MDGVRFTPTWPTSSQAPCETATNNQATSQSDMEANSFQDDANDEEILKDSSRMWISNVVFLLMCLVSSNFYG